MNIINKLLKEEKTDALLLLIEDIFDGNDLQDIDLVTSDISDGIKVLEKLHRGEELDDEEIYVAANTYRDTVKMLRDIAESGALADELRSMKDSEAYQKGKLADRFQST